MDLCRKKKEGKIDMQWQIKNFDALSTDELYEILKLRVDVFVVEQHCPYPEIDGKDRHDNVMHLIGRDSNGCVVTYLRVLPKGVSFEQASMGRVVVAFDQREKGLCRKMVRIALDWIDETWAGEPVKIGAQVYLKSFYEAFGFAPVSNSYLEDGIPHIDMVRPGR